MLTSALYYVDQCQRNTCNFYCLLNSWSTEANACGLEVPMFTEPSNTLQKQEIFRRINDAASTAESAWTTEAAEVDSSLSSVEPPNRAGVILLYYIIVNYFNSCIVLQNMVSKSHYVCM